MYNEYNVPLKDDNEPLIGWHRVMYSECNMPLKDSEKKTKKL